MFQGLHPRTVTQIPEPPIAKFLLADTRIAWLWLIIRLSVGYQWLSAGWEKLTGYSLFGEAQKGGAWVFNAQAGAAMKGFATHALTLASGEHSSVQSWYAWFLQNFVIPNATVFAY